MNFFEIENLRSVTNARWLRRPERPPTLNGVGIDSREDLSGRAFVAIKGDTHDGHAFLGEAVKSGAGLLIVESETSAAVDVLKLPAFVGVMMVESTRRALAKLALAYRRSLRGTKVIAITGSAGKTTTKRLVHSVLSTQMQGTCSPKSFNNEIGLPLTILQARLSDKYLVVEIGTNHPGEIAELAAIAEPELAVITCIGRAHLEGLGSVEAIAREKASLLSHLQPNGVAIVNADAPLLRPSLKLAGHRVLFGESEDAELRLTARGSHRACSTPRASSNWWFEINNRQRFDLALPGKHNAMNALAAVAVGRRMGVDDESIARGLKAVEPAAMRMTPQKINGVTIYNDAYNANPDSVIAALNTFAEIVTGAKRRIVILGDMLELGDSGPDLHREIGRHVLAIDAASHIDHAIFIGEHSAFAAAEVARQWPGDRVIAMPTVDAAAIAFIQQMLKPGDAVLLKASRGMGLERLVQALEQRGETEASKLKISTACTEESALRAVARN